MLCAGLRGRDQLCEPLFRVYQRQRLVGRAYCGYQIVEALRSALAANQTDNRLEELWRAMLDNRPSPMLPGSQYDGFDGMLSMPPSSHQRGQPAFSGIGYSLTRIAESHGPRRERVGIFRNLITHVCERYPDQDWDWKMIEYSDQNSWSRWTDVPLPSLYKRRGRQELTLWRCVLTLLEHIVGEMTRIEMFCGGRVIVVAKPPSRLNIVHHVADRVEWYRRLSLFGGRDAEIGLLSSAIEEVKLQMTTAEDSRSLREVQARFVAANLRWSEV
jgi:hypothetical protein